MLPANALYKLAFSIAFQRAPTLGGECYSLPSLCPPSRRWCFNGHPPLGVNATGLFSQVNYAAAKEFQWAPTLGGECYASSATSGELCSCAGFNGHPPLRVNATGLTLYVVSAPPEFQWAPTLGGECYMRDEVMHIAYNYHFYVSMGTHPWG